MDVRDRRTGHYVQPIAVKNIGPTTLLGPVYLILDNLSVNASLFNASGVTNNPPASNMFVVVPNTTGGLAACGSLLAYQPVPAWSTGCAVAVLEI